MDHRVQRFGIDIGRGWGVLLLLAGALLLVAYWIGPLRPLPAELELLAVSGDAAVEQIDAPVQRTVAGGLRFAVPLAVRNVGARAAHPSRLMLSVPAQFRLASTRGRIAGEVNAGVPLRRYVFDLSRPEIQPGVATQVLPGLDTIYLEPDLPRYYCATQGLQIPEFGPAPQYDAQTLSNVRIFYSFTDAAGLERQTGLLTVQLDPELLDVSPAAMPPTFRTIIEEPEARAPDVGVLAFAGARTAYCGDPEQPVELYTVLWETRAGGRVFVVYVGNTGRKRLYDLNRDGIIELETWDGDGDGRFEARRDARYAVPGFLMPLPPRDPAMTQPDPVRPDSAWLALFHGHGQGPRRFAQSSLTAHPPIAAADTAAPDTSAAATGTAAATMRTPEYADLGPVPPATAQFLALFADTSAGPFRFAQRARAAGPRPTVTRPGAVPPPQATTDTDTVAEEPAPEPRRRPRRPPLGTPIPPR